MSVTAWKTSQTQNNEAFGDGNAWGNLSNITTSDDQYAACSIAKNEASDYLNATNFGFSIPSTATIQGIEVQIELKSDTADTTSDQTIQLLVNGSRSGDNKAISDSYPTSDTTRNYGGTADTWGLNLTPADVNSTDFGISIQSYSSGGASTAYIDYVAIQITYSENGITVVHDTKAVVKTNVTSIADTSTCVSQQGDNVLNAQGEYTGGATLDGDEKFSWYSSSSLSCDNSIYIQDMNIYKENGKTYYAVFEPQNVCVPDTAEINGIEAIIRQRTYTSGQVVYEDVFKLYDGSDFSGNKADTNHQLPESYEDRTIGSPTDTWGLTITPDNVQDIDLYLKYNVVNNSSQTSDVVIDCVSFKIYYTVGGASYTQTHDTSAKIITTISNIQDTKSAISSQYSINQDTKEITKILVSSISDTSASILTNLTQLHDTNSAIANLISNLQDTQANISIITSAIHDTYSTVKTSIQSILDTYTSVTNLLAQLHDSKTDVTTLIDVINDTNSQISSLITNIHDTEVQVSAQVLYTQFHDTLAAVKNTIETLQDTHSAISSAYENLSDTKSIISYFKSVTHDTQDLVLTAIENIHDTTTRIATLITEITDTLATISTSVDISQDSETTILTTIDETFDTLIDLNSLIEQFHDTKVQVSLPVIETYHDMKAEITTSIAKLIDSKAFISNLYENLADIFVLVKTKRTTIHDTSLSITTQLNKLFNSYAQVSSLFEKTQDTKTVAKFSIEEYFDSYARVTTEILNRADLKANVSTKIDLNQDTEVIGKTLLVYYHDTQLKCIDHPIVSKLFKLADRLNKLKILKPRIKCFEVADRDKVFETETRPKVFKLPNRKFLYNNR